ncbi:MAG: class I SAM-dependent methyltransferase [Cyanobacteria bacterium P01_H01_bin.15]
MNDSLILLEEAMMDTNESLEYRLSILENSVKTLSSQLTSENTGAIELGPAIQSVPSGMIDEQRYEFLQDTLKNAQLFSSPNQEWPSKIRIFPFNLRPVQKRFLRIYNFFMKKQRVVNNSLIQPLSYILQINSDLETRIYRLEATLQALLQTIEKAKQDNIHQMHVDIQRLDGENNKIHTRLNAVEAQVSIGKHSFDDFVSQVNAASELVKRKTLIEDNFYLFFENRYRGTESSIQEKLRVYFPYVKQIANEFNRPRILDVGCGRGEWLKLLEDELALSGTGVDSSITMVEQCQNKGLTVEKGDAIQYLNNLPDHSLEIITAFHIIEHLPIGFIYEFFREIKRVLNDGGLFIIETPNCSGSGPINKYFYLDPTHIRPLPPELLITIAEFHELYRLGLLHLNPLEQAPVEDKEDEEGTENPKNQSSNEAQDYALLGYG